MSAAHGSAVGALVLLLAAVGAVVGVAALALDRSGSLQIGAVVAALAGAAVAWVIRDSLRPSDRAGTNRWWLVAAVVLGGILVLTPDAIQALAMSTVAGYLVACSIVVAARYLGEAGPKT